MREAVPLPSAPSAEWRSKGAAADGENATQAAGIETGSTAPLVPEV